MVLTINGEKMEIVIQRDLIIDKVRELRVAKQEDKEELLDNLIKMDVVLESMENENHSHFTKITKKKVGSGIEISYEMNEKTKETLKLNADDLRNVK